jgi:hypothetical protein
VRAAAWTFVDDDLSASQGNVSGGSNVQLRARSLAMRFALGSDGMAKAERLRQLEASDMGGPEHPWAPVTAVTRIPMRSRASGPRSGSRTLAGGLRCGETV